MPMPPAYRHASRDWQALLDDLKDEMGLATDNMAFTTLDAVLRVFRRRLDPSQGLAFAAVLPAVPRAAFVTGWDVTAPPVPFAPREAMTREAQAVRPDHSWTPDDALVAVARAVRRHVHQGDLDGVLAALPEGAADYWALPPGEAVGRRVP